MNKKEYIESISSKLSDKNVRNALEQELSDHIECKAEFQREIGYDDETAMYKALEAMGEPEPVAEQMKNIHKSGNFTLLQLCIYAVLLLLGFFSMLIYQENYIDAKQDFWNKAVILSFHMLFMTLASFMGVKYKSTGVAVINIIAVAVSLYLNLFNLGSNAIIFAVSILLTLFILFNSVFVIRYKNKINQLKNTKRDLKNRKRLFKANSVLAVILALCAVISSVFLVKQIDRNYEQYADAVQYSFELVQSGDYKDAENLREKYPDIDIQYQNDKKDYIAYFEPFSVNYTHDFDWYYINCYASSCRIFVNDFVIYNPFKTSKAFINDKKEIEFGKDMTEKEIFDTLMSYHPLSVTIENDVDGTRKYVFGYKNGRYSYSKMVYVDFNSDGSLKNINSDVNLKDNI